MVIHLKTGFNKTITLLIFLLFLLFSQLFEVGQQEYKQQFFHNFIFFIALFDILMSVLYFQVILNYSNNQKKNRVFIINYIDKRYVFLIYHLY